MKDRNLPVDDNWKTPDYLYNQLDKEFGFDYDPCRYNEGKINFNENGLIADWGKVNFVNPPYSKALKEAFIRRAITESRKGNISVLLLPVSTSTAIFHDMIQPSASEIRFLKGRVKFEKINPLTGKYHTPKNGGMHDSMIVIFKPAA